MKNIAKMAFALVAAIAFSTVVSAQKDSPVHYGNNLGLEPAAQYASQFRYENEADLTKAKLAPTTTFAEGAAVQWSVEPLYYMRGIKINAKTGELSFYKGSYRANSCGIVMVTATTGGKSVRVPVFFNFPIGGTTDPAKFDYGYKVTYDPFVVMVNPEKGGVGAPAKIEGDGFDPANFSMDFRRNFHYVNFNGPASHDGLLKSPKEEQGKLLYQVWAAFNRQINRTEVNTGEKRPVSYFANLKNLALPACYVNNADGWKVVVNPGKWKDADGNWANGAFIGQVTYVNMPDGLEINNGQMYYPVVVWFDERF